MIEAYAFLVMFTIQILAMSVLFPARFIRYLRLKAASFPDERLAQLYPGVDFGPSREQTLTRYRALNTGIAVLGVLLLGWQFEDMRHPDRDDDLGLAEIVVAAYFLVQLLPAGLLAWHLLRFLNMHRRWLLEGRRTAMLRRRGLFTFVSPWLVFAAAVGYLLFAALMIQQRFFAGLVGFVYIGIGTMVYAVNAFVVHTVLYGKKPNPLETHAGHVRWIGLVVQSSVYSCIACVAFLSLYFALELLDRQRWEPSALSAYLMITAFPIVRMISPPRTPGTDGDEPLTPGMRHLTT